MCYYAGMIQKTIVTMALLCGAVVAPMESAAAARWQTNMARVLETAQKGNRTVLVEFTGADWCPPCQHLRSQVFPTDLFADYVREHKLLLVELDFPRDAQKLSEEQKVQNEEWRRRFGVTSFPTVVVTDAKGRPFAVVNGASATPQEYLERLDKELERKQRAEAALAEAKSRVGKERAEAEDAAIRYLPAAWRVLHEEVVQDIIDNDPEDSLGYKRQREETRLTAEQMQQLEARFREFSGKGKPVEQDAALEMALSLLEDDAWLPIPRFFINKFLSDSYAIKGDVDNTLKYMKAAVAAAPESDEARRLMPWVKNLEEHLPEIKQRHAEAAAKKADEQK